MERSVQPDVGMHHSARRIYADAYFFIFDIENILHIEIRDSEFAARFVNSLFIEERGSRLYIPITVRFNRKQYDIEQITELLGFTPLFKVNARYRHFEITTASKARPYQSASDLEPLITKAQTYAMFNNSIEGGNEESFDKIEKILGKYGYEMKKVNQRLVCDKHKFVISNESLSELMKEYKGYDIIRPRYQVLYDCICDSENKNMNITIGYYVIYRGEVISLIPRHHIAIFDRIEHSLVDAMAL